MFHKRSVSWGWLKGRFELNCSFSSVRVDFFYKMVQTGANVRVVNVSCYSLLSEICSP